MPAFSHSGRIPTRTPHVPAFSHFGHIPTQSLMCRRLATLGVYRHRRLQPNTQCQTGISGVSLFRYVGRSGHITHVSVSLPLWAHHRCFGISATLGIPQVFRYLRCCLWRTLISRNKWRFGDIARCHNMLANRNKRRYGDIA